MQEEDLQEIFAEEHTVSQKVSYIVETIKATKRLCITDLFMGMKSRQEIICTFLAVLELIKLNRIAAVQDDHFGSIMVEPREAEKNEVETSEDALVVEGELL